MTTTEHDAAVRDVKGLVLEAIRDAQSGDNSGYLDEDHALLAARLICSLPAIAALSATPAVRDDSGEVMRLRAYYDATEALVCVWRDTNNPSSMDEEAWEEPRDDPDGRWEKFCAARAALEPRKGGE
jgi:hypothetical protein